MFKVQKHPNGFTKVKLFSLFGYSVRLHFWNKKDGIKDDIHDHRWDFWSLPLYGKFLEKKYNFSFHHKELSYSRIACIGGTNGEEVYQQGRNFVFKISEHERKWLRPYKCEAFDIHSLELQSQYGLTLVLTGPPKRDHALVWR